MAKLTLTKTAQEEKPDQARAKLTLTKISDQTPGGQSASPAVATSPVKVRDDAAVRRSYADRHPEETGGEVGAALRALNTEKVHQAQAKAELATDIETKDPKILDRFAKRHPEMSRSQAETEFKRLESELAKVKSQQAMAEEGLDQESARQREGRKVDAVRADTEIVGVDGGASTGKWKHSEKKAEYDRWAKKVKELETALYDDGILSRIGDTVIGGAKGAVASTANAMTTMYEMGQGGRDRENQELLQQYADELERAERALKELEAAHTEDPKRFTAGEVQSQRHIVEAAQMKYNAMAKVVGEEVQQRSTDASYGLADDIQEAADMDVSRAKKGLGGVGEVVVDAGASMTQSTIDGAVSALLGAPQSMLSFAFRAFGGGTQQARQDGAEGLSDQALYGAAMAVKEVFTEKMFNMALPYRAAYGSGSLDDAVERGISKAVDKYAKTELGKRALGGALTLGAGAAGEGLEEYIGDWMEWQMPRIYGGDVDTAEETAEKAAYDFLVGFASGALGGSVTPDVYRYGVDNVGAQKTVSTGETGRTQLVAFNDQERLNLSSGSRNKIVSGFENLVRFVREALGDGQNIDRAYMGKLPESVVSMVREQTDMDISGFSAMMNGNDVRHIMKDHSDPVKEAALGQLPVTPDDIAKIEQILADPERVRLSPRKDSKGRTVLEFSKEFNGRYITLQAISVGKHLLQTDTMYIKKKNSQDTGHNAANSDPVINAQGVPSQSSSDPSIPQTAQGVNPEGSDLARLEAREQELVRGIAELDRQRLERGVEGLGIQGQATVKAMYLEGQDAGAYVQGMRELYAAGRAGVAMDSVDSDATRGLNDHQRRAAYEAGKMDARAEDLPFYFGSEKGVKSYEQAGGVRVREGGQRLDGAGAQGAIGGVAEGAGGDVAGADRAGPADAGAGALQVGRAVSTHDLGIADGVKTDSVLIVTGGDTEATRAAKAEAAQRGLELVLFTGGDLHVRTINDVGDPVTVEARGYIAGDKVYVRADHGEFSAYQLWKHEEYHDMVATGEVDPRETEATVRQTLGDELTDKLEEAYSNALNGLEGVELWEEIGADQHGGMNIFSGTALEGDMEALGVLVGTQTDAQKAKRQTARATEQRTGPPQGQQTATEREPSGGKFSQERRGQLTKEELAEVQSIGRKSVNELTSEELRAVETFAKRYYQEMGAKSPFFRAWFGDWRANDQTPVQIATRRGDARGVQVNDDTGWNIQVSGKVFSETTAHTNPVNRAARAYLPILNDIVKKAVLLDSQTIGKAKSPNSVMMHSLYAVADIGDGPALLKLYVEEMNDPNQEDTSKRAYQLQNIEISSLTGENTEGSGEALASFKTADIESVADLFRAVKARDKAFTPKDASKVVDAEGKPLVVYHGTMTKGITAFNKDFIGSRYSFDEVGFFFVDKRSVAEDYARSDFDADRYGEVIPAYLDIKKPLLIDAKYVRENGYGDIFRDNDCIGVWDAYQGAFLDDAKEIDADGILVKDGTSMMAVVFEPTQIKSATDNIGTFDRANPDIRFSKETSDYVQRLRVLQRENQELRKRLDYWMGQTRLSGGPTVDHTAVRAEAGQLIESLGVKGLTADAVAQRLQNIYDLISTGRQGGNELSYGAVREMAEDLARDLLGRAVVKDDSTYQEYSTMRAYFKDTQLILSEADSRDIPDYGSWRQGQGRRVKLRKAKAGEMSNVDTVFKEAAGMWPEFFSEAETSAPSDQVLQIAQALEWVSQITEVNPYSSYMEEAVQWTANDIIKAYGDLPMGKGTIADQWDAKVRQAQAEGREAVRKQRLVDDMYYGRKRAETLRWARERVDRVVAYEKARTEAKIAEMKAWYTGRDAQAREYKKNSEARNRLLKLTQRLERMKTTTANKALIRELMGEIDTAARHLTGTKRLDLEQLRRDYQDYQDPNSERYNPDFIPDARTEKVLERLSRTHIDDMTQRDVEDLTKALLNLEHEIRTSKRLLQEEENRTIYQLGQKVIDEMEAVQGSKASGVGGTLEKYMTSEVLSPLRMVRRMVGWRDGSPLLKATEALNKGQRVMLDYQMRAEKPFLRFAKDKVFAKEFSGRSAREVKIGGWTKDGLQEVTITPAMRASIYLHSLNQQNARHMAEGGVTVPDMKLYKKGDLAEAYARGTTIKIKPSDTQRIFRQMSETERAFVREAQKYFREVSQPELSMAAETLRGYAPTMLENYFPIVTDKNFMKQEITFDADGTATILKPGYMEERINASGPMMLQDLDSVIDRAIQQHGLFVGMAVPVRDFNKLWNVSTAGMTEGGEYYSYAGSVKAAVSETWGETGKCYIEKMVKDVQGRQHANDQWGGWMDKLRSNYAGAVLTLNASVAIKQAASYPTAAAVLGWKPLVQAMGNVGHVDLDLIAKYTPLQWYRSKGFATKELGDMARNNAHMPKWLNWIQGMDLATTRKLWKASEYYVRDHQRALRIGSDAYYQAVAEVYNRVIEETQPNYTAMQRPQLLRSESDLMKNLAMFKTQPMQNLNILYDAAGDFLAKRRQFKAGEIDAETLRQAGRNLGNAVTSQLVQAGVFAGMTLAWAWFRGRLDKYKDKEKDEVTAEALMKAVGVDMGMNLVSGIPIIPDLGDYFVKKVKGESAYSIDVTSVSLIMDTVDAVAKLTKMAAKDLAGEGDDAEGHARTLWDAAEVISKGTGVPLENVANLFNAGFRQTLILSMGKYRGEYAAMLLTADKDKYAKDYYDNLYKAMVNDRAAYQDIYENMVNGGWDEAKIKKAMEDRMKKAQGVGSVAELERRYISPDDEADFDRALGKLESSKLWRKASPEQRDKAEDIVYDLMTGESKSTQATLEKLDVAGVDEGTYALYKLALEMADEASDDNGSFTNAEREAAIRSIEGLSDAKRAALWVLGSGKDKSNPWG